jgi:hypothetical protein
MSKKVLSQMSKWVSANKLFMNPEKCYKICNKALPLYSLNIGYGYNDKYIEVAINTKFLCLQIDNCLKWKNHIDQLVPKLSGAYNADRFMLHISNTDDLKSVSCAYFHSLMKYGIIYWGNSCNSRKKFTLQKKIIRIVVVSTSIILVEIYLRDYRS